MRTKAKAWLFWVAGVAFTVGAFFGFRCPAQGCPACKMVGK